MNFKIHANQNNPNGKTNSTKILILTPKKIK